ncbi:MAG TPA: 2-dehydro-3-deoxyphosphogluconate aldolase [Treponema sp.]|nr:2-dehydro-3-deoxyphosphogluconate aldolase [Treponema sp.]
MFESMNEEIEKAGLIPVVTIDRPEKAEKLAAALIKGGIRAVEITFRTTDGQAGLERIAECIRVVNRAHPDMLVGAGTVINAALAQKAAAAGAKFIVSPGFNPETVDYCISESIPVYPGVNCASQIEAALGKGLSVLKFFPAEASGGVRTLNALGGPFPGVRFMATGGITEQNIGEYMKCGNIISVGGSWMVKEPLIAEEKWDEITAISKKAVNAMLGFSFAHVGINFDGDAAASEGAAVLGLFGYEGTENPASWFCGDSFELMKKNGRGVHGHIGFYTYNVERALSYLSRFGFNPVMETAQWYGEEQKSALKFIYLDKPVGGFEIHLKRV